MPHCWSAQWPSASSLKFTIQYAHRTRDGLRVFRNVLLVHVHHVIHTHGHIHVHTWGARSGSGRLPPFYLLSFEYLVQGCPDIFSSTVVRFPTLDPQKKARNRSPEYAFTFANSECNGSHAQFPHTHEKIIDLRCCR